MKKKSVLFEKNMGFETLKQYCYKYNTHEQLVEEYEIINISDKSVTLHQYLPFNKEKQFPVDLSEFEDYGYTFSLEEAYNNRLKEINDKIQELREKIKPLLLEKRKITYRITKDTPEIIRKRFYTYEKEKEKRDEEIRKEKERKEREEKEKKKKEKEKIKQQLSFLQ